MKRLMLQRSNIAKSQSTGQPVFTTVQLAGTMSPAHGKPRALNAVLLYIGTVTPLIISLICVLAQAPAMADTNSALASQRKDFLAAEQALRQGAMSRFLRLQSDLAGYPLAPYLQYQNLRNKLTHVPASQIQTFIKSQSETPLADRLQFAWITGLARRGHWTQLIDSYIPGTSVTQECYFRQALLKTGATEQAFDDLERLWAVGFSQSRACDPVFRAWHQQGNITPLLSWQRFELAMNNNNARLARYLVRFLPTHEQRWGKLWVSVHKNPALIKSRARFASSHPMRNAILMHGLKRMARKDPLASIEIWENNLSHRYSFNDDESATIERNLALALAVRGLPEALGRLAEIDEQAVDKTIREWRIRAALNEQNWYAVLAWIHQLTVDQQSTSRWSYWKARALESLSQPQHAREIYQSLVSRRSYYGLLAALRINQPIQIHQQALETQPLDNIVVAQHPGIRRAQELFLFGRIVDARREWYYATRNMAEWQLQSAAKLAQEWGWHDRAIMTMARTRQRDDLDLRFPLPHREKIISLAAKNQINTAFVFAIIRQESAFTPDARSHAGALGLMQLLPRTAKQVAKRMNLKINHNLELLNINTNLQLGMAHLGEMLSRFNNNKLLAAAAYNAGRYRVNKWIPRNTIMPADIWVETIPFRETRNYIQNVMLFSAIYEQKLGGKPVIFKNGTTPIAPSGTILASFSGSENFLPITEQLKGQDL